MGVKKKQKKLVIMYLFVIGTVSNNPEPSASKRPQNVEDIIQKMSRDSQCNGEEQIDTECHHISN